MGHRGTEATQGFQRLEQFIAFDAGVGGDDQDFLAVQLRTHG
jgi:hypothetical protein